MAESLAALGLAANVFQFIELGCKLGKTIYDVYQSADGLPTQTAEMANMAVELKTMASMVKQDNRSSGPHDGVLQDVLQRAIDAADDLSSEINNLKFVSGLSSISERLARFIVAMRIIRGRRKIQGLNERIVELRQQIVLHLQTLIAQQGNKQANSLNNLSRMLAEFRELHQRKLQELSRDLQNFASAAASRSSSSDHMFKELFESLTALIDQAQHHESVKNILQSLHFKELRQRQNEIPQAHLKTFEWMFADNGGKPFRDWLQGPAGGIFWITGKPGSGKSTLMKFLLRDPRTGQLLEDSSQDSRPLLLLSHFFWAMGGRLQKSYEGLFRTILFQILIAYPELLPTVCPGRYSAKYSSLESWSVEELSESFRLLINLGRLPARIFILVDGLDEYDGEPTHIAKVIHTMASSPDIKICCASRPWRPFELSFKSAFGIIRVHDLTQKDIQLYVQDSFNQNGDYLKLSAKTPQEAQELMDAVTSRAEGVFFWAFLVVRSLIRGLDGNDSIKILHQRLNLLPTDLDAFLERILVSIDPVYQDKVADVINCLLAADKALPVVLFSVMDEMRGYVLQYFSRPQPCVASYRDPPHIMKGFASIEAQRSWPSAADSNTRASGIDGVVSRKDAMLHQCRDLVQSWNGDSGPMEWLPRIGFIHRTVVDFLRTPKARSILPSTGDEDHFFTSLIVSWTYLIQLSRGCSYDVLQECACSALTLMATRSSTWLWWASNRLDHQLKELPDYAFCQRGEPRSLFLPLRDDGAACGDTGKEFTKLCSIVAPRVGIHPHPCTTYSKFERELALLQALQPMWNGSTNADACSGGGQDVDGEINLDGLRKLLYEYVSSKPLSPLSYLFEERRPSWCSTLLEIQSGKVEGRHWQALNMILSGFSLSLVHWNLEGGDDASSLFDLFLYSLRGNGTDNSYAACEMTLDVQSTGGFGYSPWFFVGNSHATGQYKLRDKTDKLLTLAFGAERATRLKNDLMQARYGKDRDSRGIQSKK